MAQHGGDDDLRLQMHIIGSGLVKNFLDAKIRFDEASESLKALTDRTDTNRAQRILEAGCRLAIARQEMIDAHTRLSDFVAPDGVTPDA